MSSCMATTVCSTMPLHPFPYWSPHWEMYISVYHFWSNVVIPWPPCQNCLAITALQQWGDSLFSLSLSLPLTLTRWTEPESVPASGEQCKHPGFSSEPASPDRTRPPQPQSQPAHSPRVTQRQQQSRLCRPVIDDTQEFHSRPPCVFGLPWRPGENKAHHGYWVSQPWSQGKR